MLSRFPKDIERDATTAWREDLCVGMDFPEARFETTDNVPVVHTPYRSSWSNASGDRQVWIMLPSWSAAASSPVCERQGFHCVWFPWVPWVATFRL